MSASSSSSPGTSPTVQYPPQHTNRSLGRRKSLCLPTQPPPTPIPPSLLKSPYLNSPRSIFQRKLSTPRLPSEEDEHWLQDTVPVQSHQGSDSVDNSLRRTQSAYRSRGTGDTGIGESDSEESHVECGRSPHPRRLSRASSSLPFIDWRKAPPGYVTRSSWLAHSHTEPHISYVADDYFSNVAIMR